MEEIKSDKVAGRFYKKLLMLGLPVALQNLFTSCGNMVDTAMVTRLGNAEITAVGIAGRWMFFILALVWGIAAGASSILSQYFGAGDEENLKKAQACSTGVTLTVGIFSSLVMSIFARELISLFNSEPAVLDAGETYLRITGGALVFNVIATALISAWRVKEDVKTPMIVSGISVLINSGLNYLLIYGNFGFPRLGVLGAAIATAISYIFQPTVYIIRGIRKKHYTVTCLPYFKKVERAFLKKFLTIVSLSGLNEIVWAGGMGICTMFYAQSGSDNYAAYTVYNSVMEMSRIFFFGLGAASSVLIGQAVGKGRHQLAYNMGKNVMIISHIAGAVIGIGLIFVREPVLSLFGITSDYTFEQASKMLLILGISNGWTVITFVSITGVFRAGGDTKTGIWLDGFGVYFCAVPVVIILSHIEGIPFYWFGSSAYLADEFIKGMLCWKHFLSRKWIRQITRAGNN